MLYFFQNKENECIKIDLLSVNYHKLSYKYDFHNTENRVNHI